MVGWKWQGTGGLSSINSKRVAWPINELDSGDWQVGSL